MATARTHGALGGQMPSERLLARATTAGVSRTCSELTAAPGLSKPTRPVPS
jgi:hypothetical protein